MFDGSHPSPSPGTGTTRVAFAAVGLAALLLMLPGFAGRAGAFSFGLHPGRPQPPASSQPHQNPWGGGTTRHGNAAASAASRMAQSGVSCEQGVPEKAVEACAGKNAGDACTVEGEDHSFTGVCATTPSGVLACQPPPPPPPSADAIAACASLQPGNACQLTSNNQSISGLCRSFSSGVVACVPVPMPLQGLIDACTGKAAGDACTFTHEDDSVSGSCTALDQFGGLLICAPQKAVPPPIAACAGKAAGDACTFTRGDDDGDDDAQGDDNDQGGTVTGTCVMPPGQDVLVCQPPMPPPPVDPCMGKNAGDACSITHDDETVNGLCAPTPESGGMLICVPQQVIPPRVTACIGKQSGAACSFSNDGRDVNGNCVPQQDNGLLVCQPPPPQALIDACTGKAAGDACSVTLGDHSFTGACGLAPDGVTLACMPPQKPDQSPRVAACSGKPQGSVCMVQVDDHTQRGLCRPNDEGVLACLPPAPPQDAIDACNGLSVGATCSFPWGGQTVTGACKALAGGSTLVCAPLCAGQGTSGGFGFRH